MDSLEEPPQDNKMFVTTKRIVIGLNYLAAEAHNSGNAKVARILQLCSQDVCRSLERGGNWDDGMPYLLDSNLYAAIRFLAKFASIKDKTLKQEILKEIRQIHRALH